MVPKVKFAPSPPSSFSLVPSQECSQSTQPWIYWHKICATRVAQKFKYMVDAMQCHNTALQPSACALHAHAIMIKKMNGRYGYRCDTVPRCQSRELPASPHPIVWVAYRDSEIDLPKHIQHGEKKRSNIKRTCDTKQGTSACARDHDSSVVFSFFIVR